MTSATAVANPEETAQECLQPYAEEVLAGEGAAASLLRLQVMRIAPHFRTALVTGEPGTGKASVARRMHGLSGAAHGPFSRMDVAAFAQNLERVELHGLLYLYGLERLEPRLQERLATRLKQIQRETRIVFASECDLRGMLATGRLRQSLASRVGALEIHLASLRDRMEDFEELAHSMLERQGSISRFGADAMETLSRHAWPGNLAELWKVTSHVAGLGRIVETRDLPELVTVDEGSASAARLDQVMQRHVLEVLQRCSGNKLRAAELLGISRSTLYRMLEAAGDATAE